MGAHHALVREEVSARADFIQLLCNRQRVPDLHAGMDQAGNADRRGFQQQFRPCLRVFGRNHLRFDGQAGAPREQETPQ